MNLKKIHIGELIKIRANELGVSPYKMSRFLKCPESTIDEMFLQNSLDTDVLLRLSKFLQYDFFRVYSGHLILYSPQTNAGTVSEMGKMPVFRKNIYTVEIKKFILEKITEQQMSVKEVTSVYGIPKTTLNRWIKKA